MRYVFAILLGIATGLALYGRIPHLLKPHFTRDLPATPPDWRPKYYINGQPVSEQVFMDAIPLNRPEAERLNP